MSKIKILSSKLINQIAAGEVIERPFSVVKELVENSIDANATHIKICIENGGHKLIHVVDNGEGMDKNDLLLSFKRHATSKIISSKDLFNIHSLGFRGEALPSISSISQLIAKSSTLNSDQGYSIEINGSEMKEIIPVPPIKGTNIQIRNIFYNIPARRKFLKKPETEQRIITSLIRRFILSHPEIAFTLIANNKEIYKVVTSTFNERLVDIYGQQFFNELLPVNLEKSPYSVSGYTGTLNTIKKRQGEQYLFVNGRFIKDRLMSSAVFSAYRSLVTRGEFPFFILFIELPFDEIDVNVHPTKLEVRFQNEWHVHHVIKTSITNALLDILKVIPNIDNRPFDHNIDLHNRTSQLQFEKSSTSIPLKIAPRKISIDDNEIPSTNYSFNFEQANSRLENFTQNNSTQNNHKSELINDTIWQIHNKYLIAEISSGLVIIDQHVAHERVLYESAKTALNGNGLPSQSVLFPQTISFLPDEYDKIYSILPYLEKMGFKVREFSENTVIIEGIPTEVHWGSEKQVLIEILENFIENKELDASFIDYMAATYACKAAIKAGDALKPEERRHLIDRLFSTEHPYYCPHGRPIIINLSLSELDKRFERH